MTVTGKIVVLAATMVACAAIACCRAPAERTTKAPGAAESDPVVEAPSPDAVDAAPPAVPGAKLLGMKRPVVEKLIAATKEEEGGWVRYGDDLAIRYEGGVAVEVSQKVPAGLTCMEAAEWMGFEAPGYPIMKVSPDECVWPGISMKHRLADGVAGEIALAEGVFRIRTSTELLHP